MPETPSPAARLRVSITRVEATLAAPLGLPRGTIAARLHGAYATALAARGVDALAARASATQRWEFPAPWSLRGLTGESGPEGTSCSFDVVLFGRGACDAIDTAMAAWRDAEVEVRDRPLRFASVFARTTFEGTFAEWATRRAESLGTTPAGRLRVELREPFDTRGDPFSLAKAAGGTALLLARWQLEDEGASASEAKAIAEAAAADAEARVGALATSGDLRHVRLRARQSESNGHRFPLAGWVGSVLVEGDVAAALPDLEALALRGGRHRKFGLSEVDLRRDEA